MKGLFRFAEGNFERKETGMPIRRRRACGCVCFEVLQRTYGDERHVIYEIG
ncbi:hypothetical protein HMPREF0762_00086 [Slackia exigua ATCC 700122]|uniref:Uncharacterized protein n=1 Tax=Slackia exigua (strain ATCC 700122 / DSM 15923 / CIP 105133 / JCM 11022 / KCTC 5966 / S-7) TaxID=649764 RepID=D0WE61_SLAES|nr:hypothetical protein HMPREF0762_00086 [Slackia exigua ATCC 700122]